MVKVVGPLFVIVVVVGIASAGSDKGHDQRNGPSNAAPGRAGSDTTSRPARVGTKHAFAQTGSEGPAQSVRFRQQSLTKALPGTGARRPCPREGALTTDFLAYNLGSHFHGLARTMLMRVCHGRSVTPSPHARPGTTAAVGRANFVSSIYGDCEAAEDSGCAPPLEVQSWPACERNLARYTAETLRLLDFRATQVRGVPAGWFGSTRLEIYAGRTTIVIFGRDRASIAAAARVLQTTKGSVQAGAALPEPARGALKGEVSC
jgi:hypothetical protein